jgi:hypothetical protein
VSIGVARQHLEAKWPPATDEPSYFRLSGIGQEEVGESYYGFSVALQNLRGPDVDICRADGRVRRL